MNERAKARDLRPDALPAEFYKSFEELVRRDFLRILNLAMDRGQLCSSNNDNEGGGNHSPYTKKSEDSGLHTY